MFVLGFEPNVMYFIQSIANPFWDMVFKTFTQLGGETLCIVIMAAIYWCINKEAGETVGFVTLCSVSANNILKDIFRFERPIGYAGINTDKGLAAELEIHNSPTNYKYSYSFPSGHSQTVSALYITLAQIIRRWWATIAAVFIVLMVGISRMYVGVHWPKDVFAGWIEGAVFSLVLFALLHGASRKKKMTVYIAFAAVISVAGLIFAGSDDTVKSLGSIVGFVAGVAFEGRFVNFEIKDVPVFKRVLRLVIGLIILIGLKVGLKALFPTTLIFGFIRYFLLLFVGMGIYPLIFKKLKF